MEAWHARGGIGWSCMPNATDLPVIVRFTLSKALASDASKPLLGFKVVPTAALNDVTCKS